jgi:hypothetical protein
MVNQEACASRVAVPAAERMPPLTVRLVRSGIRAMGGAGRATAALKARTALLHDRGARPQLGDDYLLLADQRV